MGFVIVGIKEEGKSLKRKDLRKCWMTRNTIPFNQWKRGMEANQTMDGLHILIAILRGSMTCFRPSAGERSPVFEFFFSTFFSQLLQAFMEFI